jgi:signal transduction histidine kinase/ActR/RegA family two-component response regulator
MENLKIKYLLLAMAVYLIIGTLPLYSYSNNNPVVPITTDINIISSPDKNIKNRELIARGDYNYPPFEYLDDTGNPRGFNVDIIKAVAKVTGLKIRIMLGPWHNVREELENGEIDLLIGMFKTEERMKKADFTIPHFISTYVIFTQKGSAIKSVHDLTGKKILVQKGDLGHDYVLEKDIKGEIILKQNWKEVLRSLNSGEGDAAIAALLQGTMQIVQHNLQNVAPLEEALIQRSYCIAVPKGNASLLAVINEGLNILKSTGEYGEIYEKWFGIYEKKIYPDRNLEVIIAVFFLLLLIITGSYIWNWNLKKQVQNKTEELTRELELKTKMQNQLEKAIESLDLSGKEALKARYEAEEANEAKTRFLANISHELRTPLHGIIGISKILESTGLNKEQKDMVRMINSSARNLTAILSDLLDFSSIHSGKLSLRKSSFHIKSIIDTAAPVMQLMTEEKNLDLIIETDETNPLITADKERIGQILLNLFSNAVKYTDKGSIKVSIKYYKEILEISVTDTGRGIEPEYLDSIFEPFSRIDSSGDNLSKGVGLGLSIVKNLVELMKGEINVESSHGKGSRFIVFIPAFIEKEIAANNKDSLTKSELSPDICSDVQVLVVEDENINRLYLKKIFGKKGCITDTALNGLEALDMIKNKNYNLILMDLTMPVMDGITSALKIREYEKSKGLDPVPIIALTAHAYPEDKAKCREAGMDGYLAKPFQPADLMKEIDRVININNRNNRD